MNTPAITLFFVALLSLIIGGTSMPKKGGRAATAGAASKAKASGASAARRARTPLPEALSPSNDSYFALLTSDDEADSLEVQTQRASTSEDDNEAEDKKQT
eukprot:CAMPEP_0172584868 /NCGR_PEP_ID=MMETSP1068-20121228/4424_1 /TAXON_ID=35684 /ORGANISM="Pseudopedinella elastica, Strain CCMP716" /LENGTH=100 /DNA_ID=CAMNT_0013379177 /DNA_START=224 /DNA_END=521 /DNA_ORIENTATION=-